MVKSAYDKGLTSAQLKVCAISRAKSIYRSTGDRPGSGSSRGRGRQRALSIALIYAAVAAFWILMSDGLIHWLFGDTPRVALLHPFKGLAFILVTSLLLYRLVRRIGKAAHAEAVLRQDQQRLLVMLENMPVLVAALDKDHQVAFWNQEAERVTGYSATEALGNPRIAELLLPDPRAIQCWS